MKVKAGDKPQGLAYPIDRVKKYLRVTGTDQDEIIKTMISASVDLIEHHTWIVLQSRTYTLYSDNWETHNTLPKYPVTGVTSVKYYDTNNVQQTMPSSDYWADIVGELSRVTIDSFPNLYSDRSNAVEIAFTAGYSTWYDIPEEYQRLLMLIVSDMYDGRHSSVVGTISSEDRGPATRNLLNNYSKRIFT